MFSKKNLASPEEGLSIIAPETILDGNIRTKGSLRLDGKIEGHITGAQHVVIGEKGEIQGSFEAESAVVAGKVFGNIKTKGSLRLLDKGLVQGDIRTTSLHIEEGATFEGTCTMANVKPPVSPTNGTMRPNELFETSRVITPLLK